MSVAQAPLWGMGRSIDHEHPELRCSRIDLPARTGNPRTWQPLVEELLADTGPIPTLHSGGGLRYVAGLTPFADDHEAGNRCGPKPARRSGWSTRGPVYWTTSTPAVVRPSRAPTSG